MATEVIKSKRGKDKLARGGFMYTFEKRSKDGENLFWACDQRAVMKCKARIHTNENYTVVRYVGDHNHDTNPALIEVAKVYENLKNRAISTREVTSQVVQSSVQHVSQAVHGALPEQDAMKKVVRRVRNQAAVAPPAPASLDGMVLPQEFVLPGGAVEPFLLADSGPGDDRILIFGRNRNLDIAVTSNRLYMDGTFKITPPLFSQVYTVLADKFGAAHPVVYGLLPNKEQATYHRFFEMLKELRPDLDPQHISCDFEIGALKADFEIGALPDQILPILTWFIGSYVGLPNRGRAGGRRGALFPPQLWTCYQRVLNDEPRTNNHAEAAHRRIQEELGMNHPTIWKFIDGLKKVQVSRDVFYEQLIAGHEPPKKKTKFVKCDRRIKNVVEDYHNRTVLEYLAGIAYNFSMKN